ncbi:MAG: hypothetical protein ACT4PN_18180 [Nitrospiraceae bacterium]
MSGTVNAIPKGYEGALRNQHWDEIGSTVKQHLLRQVSSSKGVQRKRTLKQGAK